ncbi:MAG: Lon-like protease [Frankiaceae bacterium]|jgi:PDZ domain-containing protein|nr:Lon-like protease [Frankiaceae bacterium]
MSRRGLTFGVAALLTAVLAVLAAVLPVPYVLLVPGPVCDTLGSCYDKTVISVDPSADSSPNGHLYLTTVGVVPGSCDDHPTLLQALRAWWDHTEAVEPHQVICPPGESSSAVQRQNEQDMSVSQRDAVTAALLQLGYKPTVQHVVVADIPDDSVPAASVLETGDLILAVEGQPVTSADHLRQLVGAHPVGTRITLSIERAGKQQDVKVKTIDSGDATHRAIIGITPDLRATFKQPHVSLGLDPAQVGGPSAGLMFTLGIIDKLTPGDLTGGRTVAGTGTIDAFGNVGPIGGVQQKIAGATKRDISATVFLTPAGDCADAKAVAPDSLTLVRVDKLQTALDALKAIVSGTGSFPRC